MPQPAQARMGHGLVSQSVNRADGLERRRWQLLAASGGDPIG